jgi:hypothetical protein
VTEAEVLAEFKKLELINALEIGGVDSASEFLYR